MIPYGVLFTPALIVIHILLPSVGGTGLQTPNNNLVLLLFSLFIGLQAFLGFKQREDLYLPHNTTLSIVGGLCIMASATVSGGSNFFAPAGVVFWLVMYFSMCQPSLKIQPRSLLWVVFASALIEAMIGFFQVLGWVIDIDGSKLDTKGTPVGAIQQANLYASYLCTGVAAWLWLMVSEPEDTPDRFNKIFTVLAASIIVAMAILSGSRTGWGSLLIVFVFGIIALRTRDGPNRMPSWLTSASLGLLIALLLSYSTENTRIIEKAQLESARWPLYQQALRLANENLMQGVGYGNFEQAYVESASRNFAQGVSQYPAMSNFSYVHNGLLQWLIEGGVLALAGVLLVITSVTMHLKGLAPESKMAFAAFLAPVGLHFMTEFPLRQSVIHAWLLLAGIYCTSQDRRRFELPYRTRSLIRSTAVTLFALIIPLYCLNNLNTVFWLREIQKSPIEHAGLAAKIIYPGPLRDKVEYTLANSLYVSGMLYGQESSLDSFITWAQAEIARLPRAGLYEQLARAQAARGDKEAAITTLDQLNFLFPDAIRHRDVLLD
jgi:O-antigen polymerase